MKCRSFFYCKGLVTLCSDVLYRYRYAARVTGNDTDVYHSPPPPLPHTVLLVFREKLLNERVQE